MPEIKLKTLAPNLTRLDIGESSLYFSYETCVAVFVFGAGLSVSENIWSRTTGKTLVQDRRRVLP